MVGPQACVDGPTLSRHPHCATHIAAPFCNCSVQAKKLNLSFEFQNKVGVIFFSMEVLYQALNPKPYTFFVYPRIRTDIFLFNLSQITMPGLLQVVFL
jgi:hypothetical protein